MALPKAAIEGGPKAKTKPYRRRNRYGDEELKELQEALEQGTLFYAQGRKVRALEEAFAASVGCRFAIACSSGTAAMHGALIAVGVSPGDEVITSPITDMGTVIPILFQGAIPVFADLDPATANMTPESVAAAMTERTRAVVAVHLAGNACDLDGLRAVCQIHGIPLIEDCAQAQGCLYRGKAVGTVGDIGCFSLNEFKHISCGDGGLIVTDDEGLADRLRLAVDKCYDRRPGVTQRNPRFLAGNYRMTELQGAVALAQLRKLPGIVERRRSWCSRLSEAVADVPGVLLPQPTEGCTPSWWFYLMQADQDGRGVTADALAQAMQAEGLPVGAHYIGQPVYRYPLFAERSVFVRGSHPCYGQAYPEGLCPNAEAILRRCLILSVHEDYDDQDLEETALGIRKAAAAVLRGS